MYYHRGPLGADSDHWWGFEAGHVFPLAYEVSWHKGNYDRWIAILPEERGMNSVQNGLLLRSDVRQLFDNYAASINTDVCLVFPTRT
jgi:HNH endonuclease